MDNNNGRPSYEDSQYRMWLDELSPFLKLGNSLNYAVDHAGLTAHKTTIYEKYNLNDWFSEKVDLFTTTPGDIVNSIFARIIINIDEKVKQGLPITSEEFRNLRFFAEKHRSCKPFFVTRIETDLPDPNRIAKVLDTMESTDYDKFAKDAEKELSRQEAKTEINPEPLLQVPATI